MPSRRHSLQSWLETFGAQLGGIRPRSTRDYSQLADVLAYEAHDAGQRWREAIDAIRTDASK